MQVFIGMPSATGYPYPEAIFNIVNQTCNKHVDILFDMESLTIRTPIQIARNELLDRFLTKTDADYLWFCDDDNPPSVDVLEKLINANKDIVSAIVPLRMWDREGDLLNIFKYDEKGGREHYTDLSECEDHLIEIANCGTWCVLLSREFCEAMYKAYNKKPFAFETWKYVVGKNEGKVEKYIWQEYDGNRRDRYEEGYDGKIRIVEIPLSEDVCFFEKAKELGYTPYAELTAECYHFNGRPSKRKISKRFIHKEKPCLEQQ